MRNTRTYKNCIVTKVYDADTITVDIDLGLYMWAKAQTIRLFGINAWEVRGKERPKGLIARDALREKILNKEITLKTIKGKKGKYGRWLGIIEIDGININDWLVEQGHAIKQEY